MRRIGSINGYTLIEMVLVMIILGILAAVAMTSLSNSVDVSRTEETKAEMQALAYAIAGNPNLKSAGIRTNFGYVGDIGALPTQWDDLVTNPGYATWDGPYVQDEFIGGSGDYEFKLDAWGLQYSVPTGASFSSTGGPVVITRRIANSIDDVVNNSVIVSVTDLGGSSPNSIYRDSVKVLLTYPDGSGSMTTATQYPGTDGLVRFTSIPIGIHSLMMIYIPDNDTIRRMVTINPGRDYYADLQHFGDMW